MLFQHRCTKVFAAALISIGIGAAVLKTLDSNPLPAGAFSLSEYYQLTPVEMVISSNNAQTSRHWDCIEIAYSGTKAGNIKQLALLNGLANPADVNYHFIVCNGVGAGDGQIQPTQKWYRQWSIARARTSYGSKQTIRICLIANSQITPPTDFQIQRTVELAEALSRKFDIQPASIYYPENW